MKGEERSFLKALGPGLLRAGAGVVIGPGEAFDDLAAAFAQRGSALCSRDLGARAAPFIGLAAGAVSFSTTPTVADGLLRARGSRRGDGPRPGLPGRARVDEPQGDPRPRGPAGASALSRDDGVEPLGDRPLHRHRGPVRERPRQRRLPASRALARER